MPILVPNLSAHRMPIVVPEGDYRMPVVDPYSEMMPWPTWLRKHIKLTPPEPKGKPANTTK